jgi:tyrosine decarboxylase/aspartate 1-decarboxylase
MREAGVAAPEVWAELERRLTSDLTYESGRILGSMCTLPHDFATEVYSRYTHKNLGDPGLFPASAALERELLAEIGGLFGDSSVGGCIVSGGTEGNIIAVKTARDLRPEVTQPEVVVPETAHISFEKACDILRVKLRKARLGPGYQLDLAHYESLINENTVGLVGVAGTTSLGLLDPIDAIGRLSKKYKVFFHVDAAFGGFVLPFLRDLGHAIPPWDFSVRDVDSITADPHKMGMGVIPSGGFLVRHSHLVQKLGYEIPYLAGGGFKHMSFTGTRPGAAAISFWALMQHLGRAGFRSVVAQCWENTQYLKEELSKIEGIRLACEPVTNVVGIVSDTTLTDSICRVDDALRQRGWALGIFKQFNLARVVLMPHIRRQHVDEFVRDLREVVAGLRS